jgi:Integrase core domain
VDLVRPLPCSSEGFAYLLTVVDRSTRWAEALPLKATTTADCAAAFVAGWIARFGVPTNITSDRGVQFSSALWAAVMTKLGIKHAMTTAFHPQSNGVVERFHRCLKDALRARFAGVEWPQHLPWVMLGLRAAPREDSGVSAAELVYGAPLTIPGLLISSPERPPEHFVEQLRAGMPCVAPLKPPPQPDPGSSVLAPLRSASFVYVRSPPAAPSLAPLYRGPFEVIKRAEKFFILKIGGRFDAISVDCLKPHLGGPTAPALPHRRGRPPGRGNQQYRLLWQPALGGRGGGGPVKGL